jgi:uncharacterized repeat protein (TIGR01451 family)
MTSAITSTTPGSNCPVGGAGTSCATSVRVLVPALAIALTADTSSIVAGSAVHYTVTVTNVGQTPYAPATFADSLAGALDDGSYANDASATAGALSYDAGTLTWTGPLALGTSAVITYTLNTVFPAVGNRLLTNTVVSSTAGANCVTGTEPVCTNTIAVLVPALLITKTAAEVEVVAGVSVHYTITATNTGQADYASAELTDSLAGLLDDGIYNADATATLGRITYAAGVLNWSGALPRGAGVVITYSVTTSIVDNGDEVLENRVVSSAAGSSCTSASASAACVTSIPIVGRSLTVSGLAPSFTLAGLPGSTVQTDGAISMTVLTNNPAGYQVTVQASSAGLIGTGGNADTIPIGDLGVRQSGTSSFSPISTQPQVVGGLDSASSPNGDAVSNDYQVQIPFVAGDTYSTALDYIVTAQ